MFPKCPRDCYGGILPQIIIVIPIIETGTLQIYSFIYIYIYVYVWTLDPWVQGSEFRKEGFGRPRVGVH